MRCEHSTQSSLTIACSCAHDGVEDTETPECLCSPRMTLRSLWQPWEGRFVLSLCWQGWWGTGRWVTHPKLPQHVRGRFKRWSLGLPCVATVLGRDERQPESSFGIGVAEASGILCWSITNIASKWLNSGFNSAVSSLNSMFWTMRSDKLPLELFEVTW